MTEITEGPSRHLSSEQLDRLLIVGRSLIAEPDLESVLERVLEAARELTGARYAALGILDANRRGLERFLYTGIDEETAARIGPLPSGHGLLGELIRDPTPLRLERISDHPRSYGFPAEHPQMTSFLGAPIRVVGDIYGNIYLTDKADGVGFTEQDELLLVILADQAGIAIDKARAHDALETRRAELERAVRGLEAITGLNRELERESESKRVLELISKRGRALVEARACAVLLVQDEALRVAAVAGDIDADKLAEELPAADLLEIIRTGSVRRLQAASLASFASKQLGGEVLVAPLRSRGEGLGALIAIGRADGEGQFGEDDELVLAPFATSAAGALAALHARADERARLRVNASEQERRRWARELHDETLQELGALKLAQHSALQVGDQEGLREALHDANERLDRAISGLEELITELRPAALDELGLEAALGDLVARINERGVVEVAADFDLAYESGRAEARPDPELEATIYRLVQEALSNVVKHSGARLARVAVEERDEEIVVTVEDDGRGIEPKPGTGGFGLVGMRERVELANGSLEIGLGASGGTRVRAILPTVPTPTG